MRRSAGTRRGSGGGGSGRGSGKKGVGERAVRGVAGEQRGLGAGARPLLGHAAQRVGVRAEREHREVIGSYAELAERWGGGKRLPPDFDAHKPHIDGYTWRCRECGGTM